MSHNEEIFHRNTVHWEWSFSLRKNVDLFGSIQEVLGNFMFYAVFYDPTRKMFKNEK